MYFTNRAEAGRSLAEKLCKYETSLCSVVALSPGGVLVGAQIAMRIHASLLFLVTEKVILPGELQPLASMTSTTFTYNSTLSSGEIDEYVTEYRGMIDERRREKQHQINMMTSEGAEIDPALLRGHTVILVSDALQTGISIDVAMDYLKPLKLDMLIIATPLATPKAVDKMHLAADEIYCLNVAENLMETDHYYDDNTVPNQEGLMKILRNIAISWKV